jgi:hypothetical protein
MLIILSFHAVRSDIAPLGVVIYRFMYIFLFLFKLWVISLSYMLRFHCSCSWSNPEPNKCWKQWQYKSSCCPWVASSTSIVWTTIIASYQHHLAASSTKCINSDIHTSRTTGSPLTNLSSLWIFRWLLIISNFELAAIIILWPPWGDCLFVWLIHYKYFGPVSRYLYMISVSSIP